ncbi:sensor histidine kinase [Caloranaerobacter sp. DY30410]|uniref:sensor histidine kinase n=1 Tax=Caloranaerobacter sp. DY30410 TaxID=3238305 RepID=UPI003CFDB7F6
MWWIIEFLFSLIDTVLIFYFTKLCLEYDKNEIKKIIFVLFTLTCLNRFISTYFGFANFYGFIIMFFITGLVFNIIFKKDLKKVFFYVLIGITLSIIIEIIVISSFAIIFMKTTVFIFEESILRIILLLISKTIYFLIIKMFLINIKIKKSFNTKEFYLMFTILVFNLGILFLIIWIYKNINITKTTEKLFLIFISIGTVFFNIFLFVVIKKIIEYAQKETEWILREEEYKKQGIYIKNLLEMNNALKAQRHDFNNHLSCVYGFIMLGKIEEAKKYLKALVKNVEEINTMINISNPVILSLLNIKLNKAKRKNIKMSVKVNLPEKIDVEDIDLSIILGNLLDNAIEACEKVEEDKRYIDIDIYMKNRNVIIKIKNSKVVEPNINKSKIKERYTTKKDRDNHGFGLGNVKYVVDKYDGFMKVKDHENHFEVNIAIPQSKF